MSVSCEAGMGIGESGAGRTLKLTGDQTIYS